MILVRHNPILSPLFLKFHLFQSKKINTVRYFMSFHYNKKREVDKVCVYFIYHFIGGELFFKTIYIFYTAKSHLLMVNLTSLSLANSTCVDVKSAYTVDVIVCAPCCANNSTE